MIINYMLQWCAVNQMPWEERICSNQMVKNFLQNKNCVYIKGYF